MQEEKEVSSNCSQTFENLLGQIKKRNNDSLKTSFLLLMRDTIYNTAAGGNYKKTYKLLFELIELYNKLDLNQEIIEQLGSSDNDINYDIKGINISALLQSFIVSCEAWEEKTHVSVVAWEMIPKELKFKEILISGIITAVYYKNNAIAKTLLSKLLETKGGKFHLTKTEKNILAKCAFFCDDNKNLKSILYEGADPNFKFAGKKGTTLLMCAAKRNQVDLVETLILKGVRITDRNKYGETALDIADKAGHSEVVRVILKPYFLNKKYEQYATELTDALCLYVQHPDIESVNIELLKTLLSNIDKSKIFETLLVSLKINDKFYKKQNLSNKAKMSRGIINSFLKVFVSRSKKRVHDYYKSEVNDTKGGKESLEKFTSNDDELNIKNIMKCLFCNPVSKYYERYYILFIWYIAKSLPTQGELKFSKKNLHVTIKDVVKKHILKPYLGIEVFCCKDKNLDNFINVIIDEVVKLYDSGKVEQAEKILSILETVCGEFTDNCGDLLLTDENLILQADKIHTQLIDAYLKDEATDVVNYFSPIKKLKEQIRHLNDAILRNDLKGLELAIRTLKLNNTISEQSRKSLFVEALEKEESKDTKNWPVIIRLIHALGQWDDKFNSFIKVKPELALLAACLSKNSSLSESKVHFDQLVGENLLAIDSDEKLALYSRQTYQQSITYSKLPKYIVGSCTPNSIKEYVSSNANNNELLYLIATVLNVSKNSFYCMCNGFNLTATLNAMIDSSNDKVVIYYKLSCIASICNYQHLAASLLEIAPKLQEQDEFSYTPSHYANITKLVDLVGRDEARKDGRLEEPERKMLIQRREELTDQIHIINEALSQNGWKSWGLFKDYYNSQLDIKYAKVKAIELLLDGTSATTLGQRFNTIKGEGAYKLSRQGLFSGGKTGRLFAQIEQKIQLSSAKVLAHS